MSLTERLAKDLTEAIRSRDEPRKSAIRMLTWAAKNAQVEKGASLEDSEVLALVAKQVRSRKESIEGFRKGQRDDLVAKEEAELAVLQSYMPPQLNREKIGQAAREVIEEVGAKTLTDKGRVMPILVTRLAGQAEGRDINAVVTDLLAGG